MSKQTKAIIGLASLLMLTAVVVVTLAGGNYTVSATRMPLRATILKVGKADAIVINAGDETLVIDCGEEEDGLEVLEYLQQEGIDHVDTLMITHYDKDHVGGADYLVENIEVGRVLLPDYEWTSTEYRDFLTALKKANLTPERLSETINFTLGDAVVIVEPPLDFEVPEATVHTNLEVDNNFSLVTTILHGDNRLVFTGDIEKQRTREWLESSSEAVACDFLKVPHHGVYNSEMENLFNTLSPTYAAITDSTKNPADEETIALLKKQNAITYQTMNGKIRVVSDGNGIEVRQK